MSLLAGLFESRQSPENPSTNLSNPASWLFDAFGATKVSSGTTVSQRTALQNPTVYACVRILAETIAGLPLITYRRKGDAGKERAPDHALYRLLHDEPNPEMTSFQWRETLMGHLLLWGNSYCEIVTNSSGLVMELWPLRPDTTEVQRINGSLVYVIRVNGQPIALPASRVLHIPGLGFDGVVGYSPVALARQAIGLAMATEEFGARFFGNGSHPGGVLTHPGRLQPEAKERLKAGWKAAYEGLSNAQRIAVLEEGVTWTAIGTPPEDAQFLETRKFQVEEICRIFRVPPHLVQDLTRSTNNNIEHQAIDFVVHTIRPWLVRWEQRINNDLFSIRDREQRLAFAEFQIDGLLRGDSAARAAFYKALFEVGALSVNEIRAHENLNPVPGGEQRFVPLNMVSLELAGQPPDMEPEVIEEPPAPKQLPSGARSILRPEALERLFADAAGRVLARELTQVRRAVKRGRAEFAEWLEGFYGEHQQVIERALTPILTGIVLLLEPDPAIAEQVAREQAAAFAAESTRHAADALLATVDDQDWPASVAGILEEWETSRPGTEAHRLAVRCQTVLPAEMRAA